MGRPINNTYCDLSGGKQPPCFIRVIELEWLAVIIKLTPIHQRYLRRQSRVRQKNLTVFKFRYIGNRVGWANATKVSG